MLFYRWAGVLLLFGCGFAGGFLLASFMRRRYRQAEGFLTLLRTLRWEIDCFSLPVEKFFSRCDKKLLSDCGAKGVPADFPSLLKASRLYMPEEICCLLYQLSGELGSSYRREQLRSIDHYLTRFSPYCDKLRNELPKKEKTAFLLPVALAAILALMLL